ncbi:MAG: ATP12 family chaperone protein, partial [Xanthobacteraceae bacterium]
MRELFEEVAANGALDPQEAVRQTSRAPQRKRFYKSATVEETGNGFAIGLDGKPVRTPTGERLAAPTQAIAQAIVEEWNAQGEFIDPMTMPLTRLANSVIAGVVGNVEAVRADVAKYFESDLLFYRAAHPEALVAREGEHWDPVLFWAADELGARFVLAEGIVHVRQPETSVAAATKALPDEPWLIAAMHIVTSITGSALLALALLRGARTADDVWAAAHVDEDWTIAQGGADAEVRARRNGRLRDFRAAAFGL